MFADVIQHMHFGRIVVGAAGLVAHKGKTNYDEEKLSPSGGLLFKATDKLSLYANYMEGLSQGKIAPSTSRNEDEIFPPFISRQVEVGAKYDAGAFAVTAAVFRIKQPAYETNATTR
jgi:iron complex outermembrane receptor protein